MLHTEGMEILTEPPGAGAVLGLYQSAPPGMIMLVNKSDQAEQGIQDQVDVQSPSDPRAEKWEPQNDISHSERGNRNHHRQFLRVHGKSRSDEIW